ncbi:uncharacterized protein LOC130494922 [Raphanus sativus]|uniref:Uncharacterized protein LOC130494922 n=1 Tax=Raphanus sativus TaxID=3726 RepID=A0A9W3BR39_RAPSA|nr:uncharacterized protein LOC130494922 [Raphanus sativus]
METRGKEKAAEKSVGTSKHTPKGTRKKSRKNKDGTGASGAGDASEPNPQVLLSVPPAGHTSEVILTETQVNQAEFQLGGEDRQMDETGQPVNAARGQLGAAGGQQRNDVEGEAESSETGHRVDPNIQRDGRIGPDEPMAEPTMKEILDAIKLMGSQMLAMTQVFTPVVNSSVGQTTQAPVIAPVTGVTGGYVAPLAEVIELDPPVGTTKKVDYLKVLEHISRLGTKHFAGSADPMEADEWRDRLVRNFKSTRCPEEYQRDIAVHFLEGDAHNWWLSLDKRTNGSIVKFSDFEVEFNHKYFPAEAWDRLEAKFLDLVQGKRSVREYEEEFNRLRRYVGKELEDEKVQVRRFIRGLRPELKTYCSVRTFNTVSELVERMAMLETNLAEENKHKLKSVVVSSGQGGDKKRKRDAAEGGKTSSGRPECPKCGKHHGGECWKAMGACTRCGKMDHSARDCPVANWTR